MRLDKLLEIKNFGGRGQVKKLLRAHQVSVDGKVTTKGSQNVDSYLQEIMVSGQKVEGFSHSYFLCHKPSGVVSAVKDAKYQTIIDIISEKDRVEGLYPIGRLDRDTEGLLLVTDNGPLGYRMLHPTHHVSKTYFVRVNGFLGEDAITFFKKGVTFLDGHMCLPANLHILSASETISEAEISLTEGKFHQVKKMFLSYGVKVIYLKRIIFADFHLGNIKSGEYRPLTDKELENLKSYLD